MSLYPDENRLVADIRARFPAEAALIDQRLEEQGWGDTDFEDIPHLWVEAFADQASAAIKRKDAAALRAQTGFIAERYRAAPDTLCAIVDVAYAENIMCGTDGAQKRWAWQHISFEIRELYRQMWGDPTN